MTAIQVTKAFLPPLEEVVAHLKRAWEGGQLTNNGPLVKALEQALGTTLGVDRLLTATNGTVALQLALEALNVSGTVLTTPFSYVATTSAILWQKCTPVFVDVDPNTLCIDASKIEAAVEADSSVILATHVYGLPCDVETIRGVAQRHRLAVLYDAAHAFGTNVDGRSILRHGDISALSFHATKLFHTGEGGGLVANSDELHERLLLMRSFGHVGDEHFGLGINGKMSELHAAVGLAVLPHLAEIRRGRERVTKRYHRGLSGLRVRFPRIPENVSFNHAYFPVLFSSEEQQQRVRSRLNAAEVYPRRYFYPSLNRLKYVPRPVACPVSEDAARTVLCLPMYPELSDEQVDRICTIVQDAA